MYLQLIRSTNRSLFIRSDLIARLKHVDHNYHLSHGIVQHLTLGASEWHFVFFITRLFFDSNGFFVSIGSCLLHIVIYQQDEIRPLVALE